MLHREPITYCKSIFRTSFRSSAGVMTEFDSASPVLPCALVKSIDVFASAMVNLFISVEAIVNGGGMELERHEFSSIWMF